MAKRATNIHHQHDWVLCAIQPDTIEADCSQRIHLIPVNSAGMVEGVDGRRWKYDGEALLRNAAACKVKLPIDYHHASLNARSSGATAPAAGWINPETIESTAEGLFGIVQWTANAAEAIRDREYLYTSPVFTHADGKTLALKGSALTHYPNLTDLTPIADNTEDNEENAMEELLERLRYVLNLPTLATADEIKAALDAGFARLKNAAGDAAENAERLEDVLACWQQQVAANSIDGGKYVPRSEFDRLRAELNAINNEREAARVEVAVNDALGRGVISPAALPWARDYCRKDPAGFAQFAANAAVVVPFGESKTNQAAAGAPALTSDELAICTALNISPEAFKAQKGA